MDRPLRVWHLVRAHQRAQRKAQLSPGSAIDAKPDGSHQAGGESLSGQRRRRKPAAREGEEVKPVIRHGRRRICQAPKPVQSVGTDRAFAQARREAKPVETIEPAAESLPRPRGRPAGPARRILPRVESPPPKPPPEQVDRILARWTQARLAGDLVTAGRIVRELRELAVRPGLSEEPPESNERGEDSRPRPSRESLAP